MRLAWGRLVLLERKGLEKSEVYRAERSEHDTSDGVETVRLFKSFARRKVHSGDQVPLRPHKTLRPHAPSMGALGFTGEKGA